MRSETTSSKQACLAISCSRLPAIRGWKIALLIGYMLAVVSLAVVQTHAQTADRAAERLQALFAGQPPKNANDLRAMQSRMTALAEQLRQCTVSVQFNGAHGSGVIVSEDGIILTVAHVVGEPHQDVRIRFSDGRVASGRSLGMHLELDAGLVRLNGNGPWPHLELDRSQRVGIGQWVAATGHPGGHSLSRGPVFRVGRILHKDDFLQTDCQLVGGDSGGPLVDMEGRVIGIHSRIGVSLVNNLHVPISVYANHWDDLLNGRKWDSRAYIGVRGEEASEVPRVAKVYRHSPADLAGVEVGDIIVSFNGIRLDRFEELVRMVRKRQPGETIRMRVKRDSEILDLDVTIGKREAAGRPTGWTPNQDTGNSSAAPLRLAQRPGRRQSIRVGKNHELVRQAFREVVETANRSTVQIYDGRRQVALGAVVRSEGYIVTKASEVSDVDNLRCRIPKSGRYDARVVGVDQTWDLALLKVDTPASGLTAIRSLPTNEAPQLGAWTAVPGGLSSSPIVVGVISSKPHRVERENGVLGVVVEGTGQLGRVRIARVLPGSSAESAGIEEGDILELVANVLVRNAADVSNVVRRHRPGESIRLRIDRNGESLEKTATLGRPSQMFAAATGSAAHLGGRLSNRRSGFPIVIQHDCLVRSHQCGGPLVDVNGRLLGLNIARAGRVTTYAIPMNRVGPIVDRLISNAEKSSIPAKSQPGG